MDDANCTSGKQANNNNNTIGGTTSDHVDDNHPEKTFPTTVAYDVGHEFNRFFSNAGWFCGVVTLFHQEDNIHRVKFDGGDKSLVNVRTEELDRLCEEP